MKCVLAIVLVGLAAGSCLGNTIDVPSDSTTIQGGINGASTGDTVIVADGRYFERLSFAGKSVVLGSYFLLDSDTSHIASTILDGDTTVLGAAEGGGIVRFVSGEDSTSQLIGITFEGGYATYGGAIYINSSFPRVSDCRFSYCSAWKGGAVYSSSGLLSLSKCRFARDSAEYGGAVMSEGSTISVIDCEFAFNRATNGGAFVSVQDEGIVRDSRFVNNYAASGGGALNLASERQNASVQVSGCQLSDNESVDYGGAILVDMTIPMISDCSFQRNRSDIGGAIDCAYPFAPEEITVSECLFEKNFARKGAVVAGRVDHLINCTVVDNYAGEGGLIWITDNLYFSIENSIIAFSRGALFSADISPLADPQLNCCDLFGNAGGDWTGVIAELADSNGNFSADPLFCDTTYGDYSLRSASPCGPDSNGCGILIGARSVGCSSYPIADDINFDLTGVGATATTYVPTLQWTYRDDSGLSQVEYQIEVGTNSDWSVAEMWNSGVVVSSDNSATYAGLPLADLETYFVRIRVNNGTAWGGWRALEFHTKVVTALHVPADFRTIQAAIDWSLDGDTVSVAPGTYSGDGNHDISFDGKAIILTSESGPENTVIDCEGSKESPRRGFLFENNEGSESVLRGFTISNGAYLAGAAILCSGASPTVDDCYIIDNLAISGAVIDMTDGSSPRIANSLFSGNTNYDLSVSGLGTLRCYYESNATISYCTFAFDSGGEGAWLNSRDSYVTVENSIVAFCGPTSLAVSDGYGGATLTCCDLYSNGGGDWVGAIAGQDAINGNMSTNPLFCDLSSDFHLTAESPCAPTNNECGELIGALSVDPTCVAPTRTWYLAADSSGDAATIQAAIEMAGQGDTILLADGRYYERIDLSGKAVCLMSEFGLDLDSAHILNTILDGDTAVLGAPDTACVVLMRNGESFGTEIVGLTITHGVGVREGTHRRGGGVYSVNSAFRMRNCIVTGNQAYIWAGIWCTGGAAALENCLIEANRDGEGACFDLVSATIKKSAFVGNDGSGLVLGGCTGEVDSCLIEDNGMTGMRQLESSTNLSHCRFIGNRGGRVGGGLEVVGADIDNGIGIIPQISDCVFMNNTAEYAAAGASAGYPWKTSAAQFNRCLFVGNRVLNAGGLGGAVCVEPTRWRVGFSNCTFVGNTADEASALFYRSFDDSTLYLDHCLFVYQHGGEIVATDAPSSQVVLSCSDVFGNDGGDWVGAIAGQDAMHGNFSADPLFCDTGAGNFHLYSHSPCLPADNGCNELVGAYGVGCGVCGDVDGNVTVNVADAVSLLFYLFGLSDRPIDVSSADVNCDQRINLIDVVFLVSYVFFGQSMPCSSCP